MPFVDMGIPKCDILICESMHNVWILMSFSGSTIIVFLTSVQKRYKVDVWQWVRDGCADSFIPHRGCSGVYNQ